MIPKVSIIILNYNGRKHTLACLRSLKKVSFRDKEIILYDNGSKDDIREDVSKLYGEVRVIRRKENIGYSAGTTDAYRYARGEYILFLNNDTTVAPDFLTNLMKRMDADPANGIVQPKLIFKKTGKLQAGCAFFTATGFLYYYGFGKNPNTQKYNVPTSIYTANGACMLVKREVISKVGLFDKDFFLYFEETDFCHRALLAGYRIWYEPKSVVHHIGGTDNSRYKYALLVYYSGRNRLTSYLKNLGTVRLLTVLPLQILLNIVLASAYLFTGKPESSLSVCRALLYNVWNLQRTMKKRAHVQNNIRRLSDREFLPSVSRRPRLEYYLRLFSGLEKYID